MNQKQMSKKRLLTSVIIGNALEWYDFALYGFYAAVIAKLFFPSDNPFVALVNTFGVFAAGFIMRPIGAIIFGHFGDHFGRKKMLVVSVVIMALATTFIGLLPTYATAGVWAAILLTLCRLLQGLSGGGEYPGSVVYLVEHAPEKHRGLWGSFSLFGSGIGFLLASTIGALVTYFAKSTAYAEISWRLPFLLGSVLGVIGLYLRLRLPETPAFIAFSKNELSVKIPLWRLLQKDKMAMLKAICIVFSPLTASYLLFVYLPTYLVTYFKFPLDEALIANSLGWLVAIVLYPVAGILSDRLGRKFILAIGAVTMAVCVHPLFLILQHPTLFKVCVAQTIFAALLALYYAAIPVTIAELFKSNVRYSGVAVPQNIAAVFGGFSPLLITLLINYTQDLTSPALYLIAATIIMIIAIFSLKETYRTPLV